MLENALDYEGLKHYDGKSKEYIEEKIALIQTQLNAKAPLASPTLTGTPKAPTATAGTNTTQIATTAFVQTAVKEGLAELIDEAPETMNTLKEVSDAIAEHQEVTDALNAAIGNKVDKVVGKGLSANDYTDTEKTKLAGIEDGANKYILPTASSTLGGVKTTSNVTSTSGLTACPIVEGVPYYKDSNTDTKVTQTLKEDNANYPLLLAPSGQTATKTTTACFNSGVTLNPSTNTIEANINGNATKIESALETATYLSGNQGNALVNSTATAGTYTALSKLNSINGYFCDVVFGKNRYLMYTSKETVDAGENSTTYKAVLLTEDGNTLLPGLLTTYGGIKTTTVNDYLLADACAKGVLNNTTFSSLLYNANTAQSLVPTVSTLAFWNGAYKASNASNLQYCKKGEFGDATIKGVATKVESGNTDLVTSDSVHKAIKERNFILIGDSYLAGYEPDVEGTIVDSWGVQLSRLLPQYIFNIQYITGSGFGTTVKGKNFLDALKQFSGTATDITDIIVCGGYNDAATSISTSAILTGITNFMTYANTTFANAKVHIGYIGATTNAQVLEQIKEAIRTYRACGSCGCGYIANIEYTLRNTQFFTSDGVHPNQIGQKNIAWNLVSYLVSSNVSVIQEKENCNVVAPATVTAGITLYTALNNDVASLYHPKNEYLTFSGLSALKMNGNEGARLTLGTLTNSSIIGNQTTSNVSTSTANASISIPINVSTANGWYTGIGTLEIINLTVVLRVNIMNGTTYLNEVITGVIIPPFTLTVDSLDV